MTMKKLYIETIPRIEALRIRRKRDAIGETGEKIIRVFIWIVAGWMIGYAHCWVALQP